MCRKIPPNDSAGAEIFIAEMKKGKNYGIEVIEIDANMEDTVFFKAVVDESLQLFV